MIKWFERQRKKIEDANLIKAEELQNRIASFVVCRDHGEKLKERNLSSDQLETFKKLLIEKTF